MITPQSLLRTPPLLAGLLACAGDDLVLPNEGEPASIEIVQGNEQFGRVGEPLAQPVVVLVADSRGRPVTNVVVSLAVDGGYDVQVAPENAATDTAGVAGFQVVLGPQTGAIEGEARLENGGTGPTLTAPVRFTAVAADAAGMTLLSGDGQSAPVGSSLPDPLVVQVADVFGNPIPGVAISWAVDGGGAVSETVGETDAEGRSSVSRTLGSVAGTERTTASADGVAGSPVTFVHTVTAGAAAQLTLVSGDGQEAVVGTPVAEELVVRLLDGGQNPVSGVPVAWVVGQGGGIAAPGTTPTGPDGLAATRWTLGTTPGIHTLTAVVSGIGIVRFQATAVAGAPPGMRLVTQPSGSARHGALLNRQPVIQLIDPSGAALSQAGVDVTVGAASGGGQVRGTLPRTTDGNGRATFTDLSLVGPAGEHTLAFSANGFTGAISNPVTLGRAATVTTIESDTPDPSPPGASVRVAFSVRSDAGPIPGSVAVRAEEGATCEAPVATGACSLALSRPGRQELVASYAGNEQFEPSSDSEQHSVEPPDPSVLVLLTAPPGSAVAGVPLDPQPVIQLRDAAGADLLTAGVPVTVGLASGGGTLTGVTSRVTDAAGRAAFEGLAIAGGTGARSLRFTAPGFTGVTSGAIDVGAISTVTAILSDSPDPSLPGQAVEVRYGVTASTGTPSGDVTVSAGGGESCSATVAAGGCVLTLGGSGSHILVARYSGGGAFAPSEDTESHVVEQPQPAGPSSSASSVSVDPSRISVITGRATVRVDVRDAAGNQLGGVPVSLSVSGSGNTVTPGSVTTNGGGDARFELTSTVAETKSITAVAAGVTLDDRPTLVVERAATETSIESDEPDPSDAGATVTVRFTVRSSAGEPTGDVTVSGGSASCVAPVTTGSCSLQLSDPGDVTLTARYAGDASFAPSEDSEGHQVQAPAQPLLRLRSEPSEQAVPGVAFDRQPEVQLALEGRGDVQQGGVAVSAALASGSGSLQGTTTVVTDDKGRAAFADLAISGEGAHTLVFTAIGYAPVTSGPITLSRAETRTAIEDDEPDPSAPGEAFEVRFRVTSDDGTPGGTGD